MRGSIGSSSFSSGSSSTNNRSSGQLQKRCAVDESSSCVLSGEEGGGTTSYFNGLPSKSKTRAEMTDLGDRRSVVCGRQVVSRSVNVTTPAAAIYSVFRRRRRTCWVVERGRGVDIDFRHSGGETAVSRRVTSQHFVLRVYNGEKVDSRRIYEATFGIYCLLEIRYFYLTIYVLEWT